jgi:hypothetical protein
MFEIDESMMLSLEKENRCHTEISPSVNKNQRAEEGA